jgi:hypothetical protein
MHWKGLAILALVVAMAQGSAAVWGQAGASPAGVGQTTPGGSRPLTTQRPSQPTSPYGSAQRYGAQPAAPGASTQNLNRPVSNNAANNGANNAANSQANGAEDGPPGDETPEHIAVSNPPPAAPAAAPWGWQDRIAWMARILLVVFGCVGVYLGLSLLKKVDRQTQYAETAAQAAAMSAQAALLHAQAIVRSERPWILVTVEPSGRSENRFMVMATNRGRGAGRIVSSVDKITTEIDQTSLPDEPLLEDAEPNPALASVILLPGESTGIKSFGREDVAEFCGSDDMLKRVEKWEEVILLYGKIVYEDLVDAGNVEPWETAWCCWYIHGRQNSGMVMAGPPAYNRHT